MNLKAFILKLLARKSYRGEFRPETFKRILIIRPEKIGDTICMLPMVRELKRALPSAEIDIYASTHNNFMFRYVPQVSNVYTRYRKKDGIKTLAQIKRMRSNRYDLVIDTVDLKFGKILALVIINPAWIIGTNAYTDRYGIGPEDLDIYYKLVPWKNKHMADNLLGFLKPLGIDSKDNSMFFPVGQEAMENAKSFLKPYAGRTLVGLNADASSAARSLTDGEICAICRDLAERDQNITIILFSSPARRQHMQDLIDSRDLKGTISEKGTKNIFDASALASMMRVVITPDTSFVHIASAFNIPTVAIFTNNETNLRYWSPRSDRHVIIQPDSPGDTIRGFSIDDTVNAACDLLKDNRSSLT